MATWKKVSVSGSNVSQFVNDAGYITSTTANHAFATASFNGQELLAGATNGNLTFSSGSGGGLNITADVGSDLLSFNLGKYPGRPALKHFKNKFPPIVLIAAESKSSHT